MEDVSYPVSTEALGLSGDGLLAEVDRLMLDGRFREMCVGSAGTGMEKSNRGESAPSGDEGLETSAKEDDRDWTCGRTVDGVGISVSTDALWSAFGGVG